MFHFLTQHATDAFFFVIWFLTVLFTVSTLARFAVLAFATNLKTWEIPLKILVPLALLWAILIMFWFN